MANPHGDKHPQRFAKRGAELQRAKARSRLNRALSKLRQGHSLTAAAQAAGVTSSTLLRQPAIKQLLSRGLQADGSFIDPRGRVWLDSYDIAARHGVTPRAIRLRADRAGQPHLLRYSRTGRKHIFLRQRDFAEVKADSPKIVRMNEVVAELERNGFGHKPTDLSRSAWLTLLALGIIKRAQHGTDPTERQLAQVMGSRHWGLSDSTSIRRALDQLEKKRYIETDLIARGSHHTKIRTILKGPSKIRFRRVTCPCGCANSFEIPYEWCAPSINGTAH